MNTVNTITAANAAAQNALVEALNTTLRTAYAAQVTAFEGDGHCQIQVIGMQAAEGLPWTPGLLMTHRLPVTTKSSDSASNYSQWAFRVALPQVTKPANLGAAIAAWSTRLKGIAKALVTLNRHLGFVDNHDKDDVLVDQMTDFDPLIDASGLEFVRCPDKDATLGHIRQPACTALTQGELENWIATWGEDAQQYESGGLPELTPEFLGSLRASTQGGVWLGTWRDGRVEVTPEVVVRDGESMLVLSTSVESRIPCFEHDERDYGESMLWQDFGALVVDEQTLGMSVANFLVAMTAGANPLAQKPPTYGQPCSFASAFTHVVEDEADDAMDENGEMDAEDEEEDESAEVAFIDEDSELLQAYRENINEAGTLEEAESRFRGRAATEGNWVAEWFEATDQLESVPDLLRPHINWDGVARQLRVDGAVYLVRSAGWTWAFTTTR
jgi:hypothetical protein